MYAKRSPGCVYHLLTADWAKTLCGLKIVPIVIDRKAKHVFASPSNKLSAGELCTDCDRFEREERQKTRMALAILDSFE